MTKVKIEPGPCGFTTLVRAELTEDEEICVHVASGCESVRAMMEELGDTFDAYAVCLSKPGENAFYRYAAEHFPVHAGCPILAGITKCIEAESRLALPRDVSITFVTE